MSTEDMDLCMTTNNLEIVLTPKTKSQVIAIHIEKLDMTQNRVVKRHGGSIYIYIHIGINSLISRVFNSLSFLTDVFFVESVHTLFIFTY